MGDDIDLDFPIKSKKEGENNPNYKFIFLVIGIIVVIMLIAGVILFYYNSSPSEISKSEKAIEQCLKNNLEYGVEVVGSQGGYIIPEKYLNTNHSLLSYGYFQGKNVLASNDIIEKQISTYIDMIMPICIYETKLGKYSINEGHELNVKINEDSVSLSAVYPISITYKNKVYLLNKKYNTDTKIRLGRIYGISQDLINKEIQNPGSLKDDTIQDISISVIKFNNKNSIVTLTDSKSLIKNSPYTFSFGVGYK